MSVIQVFGLLGALLVLAFLANKLFSRTRVPDVVVLMAMGVVLGPVFQVIDPGWFSGITHIFGTLALILILFEGGLELNIGECLHQFPGGVLLGALTYALTLVLAMVIVHEVVAVSWTAALLVGAVLGCTSVAIVLPTLQQIEVREPVKVTLMIESSLGEVLAVLTVGFILDLGQPGQASAGTFLGRLVFDIGLSLVLAVLCGFLWSRLLKGLSEQRFWHVLTFAVVLLLYAGAEWLGGAGLIAVLGFGLALANLPGIDRQMVETTFGLEAPTEEHHEKILTFHSELSFLVRTFFFVLIGVVVQWKGLGTYVWVTLGILAAIFLGRGLAVRASRWAWRAVERKEQELVFWLLPRGLITVVLALQVAEAREDLGFLPAVAFAAILVTNLAVVFGSVRAWQHAQAGAPAGQVAGEHAPETQP